MEKLKCPKCGSENLIKKGGKLKCIDCGYQLSEEENAQFNQEAKKENTEQTKGDFKIAYIECDHSRIESVENFVEDLINKKEIPVDVYDKLLNLKNLIIYVPFYRANVNYSCDYSGTACWDRQEPYQDWETYTDWVNGKSITRRRQVTKYRTVTDRQPFNGNFDGNFGFSSSMSTEHADFVSKLDLTKNLEKLVPLFVGDKFKINGKDVELNRISEIKSILKIMDDELVEKRNSDADRGVRSREQGDYSENVRYQVRTESIVDSIIYIPIQKISFLYNGQYYYKYNAVSDTFSDTDENMPTQDYDTIDFVSRETASIKALSDNIDNKTKSKRNKYIYRFWVPVFFAVIYIFMLIGVFINSNFAYDNRIPLSIAVGILGLGSGVFLFIKEKSISKLQDDVIKFQTEEIDNMSQEKERIQSIKAEKINSYINKSKQTFMDTFKEKYQKSIFNDNNTWDLVFDERKTDVGDLGTEEYDTSIHVDSINESNNKQINTFNLITTGGFVVSLIPLILILVFVNSSTIKDEYGRVLKNQWVECNDNHWYYVDTNGNKLCNQWFQSNNNWFHFNNVGWMETSSWIKYTSNGTTKWSYVDSEGKMVTNTTIDGYHIDSNGYANRN